MRHSVRRADPLPVGGGLARLSAKTSIAGWRKAEPQYQQADRSSGREQFQL